MKSKIRDQLRKLKYKQAMETDNCCWCKKNIRFYKNKIEFHENLALTPCCSLPIHRDCVKPLVFDTSKEYWVGRCEICGTDIDEDGRPSTELESIRDQQRRTKIRRNHGSPISIPFSSYTEKTSFHLERTQRGPKFIRPSKANTIRCSHQTNEVALSWRPESVILPSWYYSL